MQVVGFILLAIIGIECRRGSYERYGANYARSYFKDNCEKYNYHNEHDCKFYGEPKKSKLFKFFLLRRIY